MNQRAHNRIPLGPLEITVCFVVALECLVINALVVAQTPALSLHSLGPLAVAYHDKDPRPLGVAAVILVLLLGTCLPRGGRVAALLFVGGAFANFVSPAIWAGGVPDYVVLRGPDLDSQHPGCPDGRRRRRDGDLDGHELRAGPEGSPPPRREPSSSRRGGRTNSPLREARTQRSSAPPPPSPARAPG